MQFFDLTFTPDNKSLIAATASLGETKNEGGYAVTQWELPDGKARTTFWAPFKLGGPPGAGTNAGVYFTALSADGKAVAWGGAEERDKEMIGTAEVWEVQSLATSPPRVPSKAGKPAPGKPASELPEGMFVLKMPAQATFIKPGETKAATLAIKRGKNFDEDVTLTFTDTDVPKGVSFEPANPVIKGAEAQAAITIRAAKDAAVGDFAIKVTGSTKGRTYSDNFNLSVDPAGATGKPETRRRYLRRSRDPFTGTFDFSMAADEDAYDGKVVRIASGKLVMKGKDGEERTYTLAPNPQISYNNAACKLEDLQAGMVVRVTAKKDNPQAATRIEAVDHYGAFMAEYEERERLKREQASGVKQEATQARRETPLQKEWKRLEGTWKAVAIELEGRKATEEEFKKWTASDVLTIQEGKWRHTSKDQPPQEAKLTINPTANPKTMDVTVSPGGGKTDVGRSIYELDGDTLRICANLENAQVPPKGFTAKGSYVMVYKQEKGLPNAKSLKSLFRKPQAACFGRCPLNRKRWVRAAPLGQSRRR